MTENYDTSWDLIESDEGYLPVDENAFERKYLEWQARDWPVWLKDNLTQLSQEQKECNIL